VEFRLLGPIEVIDDGRPLSLGGKKQRSILAMLLLNANSVVSTDRLIDTVWGDAAPATVESVLQGYVSKLRRLLGLALETRSPGYVLRVDADQIDAARFERSLHEARDFPPVERARALGDALALWRGPALADLAYEDFAQPEIARLENLRLAALEARIDAELALARHADLVGELEALVREHPLRERFHEQLMLALYRAGRQVEALEAYRAARRTLVAEAGVEPGPALRELERRVLAHDPALAAPEAAPDRHPVRRARPTRRRRGTVAIALLAAVAAVVAGLAMARRKDDAVEVRPMTVAAIDPSTTDIVAAVPVGPQLAPGRFRSAVAIGGRWMWVANAGRRTVTRIDLVSRESRTFGVGVEPFGLAVASGSLWVTGRAGGLVRAPVGDPALAEAVALPQPDLTSAEEVAASGTSVWVIAARRGGVVLERLDARTGAVRAETPLGSRSQTHDIALTVDSVWVTSTLGNVVWRVSRATDRIDRIAVAAPTAIAAASHAVWVASQADDAVWKIDATTNLGREMPAGDAPTDVAVGGGAVWVANWRAGTVTRIDPTRRIVSATIDVAPRVSAVVWARGLLWVVAPERTP
jgi:DNA-binding SARP family transcriptional activator/DNA-binding beta-propeller fold protein YncE